MALADRLKQLRGKVTQTQLLKNIEKQTGVKVKKTNYSTWENGREPSLPTLKILAQYHNVTLDYLTGHTDYNDSRYATTSIATGLSETAIRNLATLKDEHPKELALLNSLLEDMLATDEVTLLDLLELVTHTDEDFYADLMTKYSIAGNDKAALYLVIHNGLKLSEDIQIKNLISNWRKRYSK